MEHGRNDLLTFAQIQLNGLRGKTSDGKLRGFARKAGISDQTAYRIADGYDTYVSTYEKVINALGYEMVVRKREDKGGYLRAENPLDEREGNERVLRQKG